MKKIVFLGSRVHVYQAAIDSGLAFEKVYALKDSFLEKQLLAESTDFRCFTMDEKNMVLEELFQLDFDILVSNGCPIIYPVDKFNGKQLLVNVHPTYLPYLQGMTPINGVFYLDYDFYGATMHFIDSGIDTGNVIYQHQETLTHDIDLGLLYSLSLSLEGDVFKTGWQILKDSGFQFKGNPQIDGRTYFNRTKKKSTIDFEIMETDLILRKIKSFGLLTQGCTATIDGIDYLIFDAEKIVHQPLLEKAVDFGAGTVFMEYDGKLLVKTIDGLIKITRFSKNLKP